MIAPMTRREHELVVAALRRYADIERSAGNAIVATRFLDLVRAIEKRPLRGVA